MFLRQLTFNNQPQLSKSSILISLNTRALFSTSYTLLSKADPFKSSEKEKEMKNVTKTNLMRKLRFLKEKFTAPPETSRLQNKSIFASEFLKSHQQDSNSEIGSIQKANRMRAMHEAWSKLSEQEKAYYQSKSNEKKEQLMQQKQNFEQTAYDIAVYKRLRIIWAKLKIKPPKFENLIKPKTVSAYTLFVKEWIPQHKITGEPNIEAMKRCAFVWKTMTDADKNAFTDKHATALENNAKSFASYHEKLTAASKKVKDELNAHIDAIVNEAKEAKLEKLKMKKARAAAFKANIREAVKKVSLRRKAKATSAAKKKTSA